MPSHPRSSLLRLRWLPPLLAALALTSCQDTSKSGEKAAGPPRDTGPRLYVLGSSIHLRKGPSPEAESLQKLPIGTECVPLGPSEGEWRKVRCGDKEGHASASLLGSEKPSLDKLIAEARDSQRKLAQREESALRAATLAPNDGLLRKELRELFFARNFELLAGLKKPLKGPKLESPCVHQDAADCLLESAGFVRGVKHRVVTKERMFVVAIGDSEQIAVYRGRFQHAKERQWLTAEVLERTRFAPTPVMEQTLFPSTGEDGEQPDAVADAASPRLGQFVLDESAQALLARLPAEWELLKRSEEGAPMVWLDGCTRRPYRLRLSPDLHGRWLAVADQPGAPFPDERWVSAAAKTERGTKLTLSRNAEDPTPQVLEIPRGVEAPASLGEALYSAQGDTYPDHREPCGSGGAGAGPAFSGEFLPEKAMAALYGRFDVKEGASPWAASGAERWRLQRFEDFLASPLRAHPWKWGTYREGEQEKMVFLTETTETRSNSTLIGGGIFSRTEDGWRLERANRVLTGLFGNVVTPQGHDLPVQSAGERGFVAVLTVSYVGTRKISTMLILLSDVGGQESIDEVGAIWDISEEWSGVCPDHEEGPRADADRCYAYDSTWKFVAHPGDILPDLVVTSKGTRDANGTRIESFHELRTFSFHSGQYTLASREDVLP
jgi:hypothetical protein